MYLFSRQVQLAPGDLRGAMAWAIDQTARVNRLCDLDVNLTTRVFSPGLGTIAFSAVAESLADLAAANETLMASDEYVDASDEGARFMAGPADDSTMALLHVPPEAGNDFAYASTVRAVVASGEAARGTAMGVEIAQTAQRITGCPTLFGSAISGPYGAVGWVSTFASVEQMEEANSALAGHADWLELLDTKARALYVESPEVTTQLIYRRIA